MISNARNLEDHEEVKVAGGSVQVVALAAKPASEHLLAGLVVILFLRILETTRTTLPS